MRKLVVFCFVMVVGLVTGNGLLFAQQQSFSFTGSEIQAFMYWVNAIM